MLKMYFNVAFSDSPVMLNWSPYGYYRLVYSVVLDRGRPVNSRQAWICQDVRFDVFQRCLKIAETGKDDVNEGSDS